MEREGACVLRSVQSGHARRHLIAARTDLGVRILGLLRGNDAGTEGLREKACPQSEGCDLSQEPM